MTRLAALVPLVILAFLLSLAPQANAQSQLYDQPPQGPVGGAGSDGHIITVADDFQLAHSASIQRIVWWGSYSSYHLPVPTTDNFTLRLYADQGGHPGALLATFAAGNDVQRFGTIPFFIYTYDLPTAFQATAGTRYWLSIVNVPSSDSWNWHVSSLDETFCNTNFCLMRSFTDPVLGPWEGYYNNLTFTLFGVEQQGCPEFVMGFDIKPDVISLNSQGRWVSGILEPPAPYLPQSIDVASVRLSGAGSSIAPDPAASSTIGDQDNDGVPDLTLKFLRSEVIGLLDGNPSELTVTGNMVGGEPCFRGSDEVRVVPVTAPTAGSALVGDDVAEIRWQPEVALAGHSVEVLVSLDDGDTWAVEAHGLDDAGVYAWRVPVASAGRARVGVRMYAPGGDPNADLSVGVSGAFAIHPSTTGVGETRGFDLRGVIPNPARGSGFNVSFALPDAHPATLQVLDVAGRRIAAREVGSLGPGRHSVRIGDRRMAAGVYLVRLERNGAILQRNVVFMPE